METVSENYQVIISDLKRMYEEDQAMRYRSHTNTEVWDEELDKRNTLRLKAIIAEMGWPSISKVGQEGAMHAWLLAQHADHDLEFQKECLRLMKAEPEGEVDLQHIALLEDRIAIGEGKPQIYGTQFQRDGEGKFVPKAILDPEGIDERRLAMGLDTLAENQEGWRKLMVRRNNLV